MAAALASLSAPSHLLPTRPPPLTLSPQVDCSSGDLVHVDFSCLFDKGLTLAKPEMVPFR